MCHRNGLMKVKKHSLEHDRAIVRRSSEMSVRYDKHGKRC